MFFLHHYDEFGYTHPLVRPPGVWNGEQRERFAQGSMACLPSCSAACERGTAPSQKGVWSTSSR